MEISEYERMYILEGKHWWLRGKRKLLETLLSSECNGDDLKILDVGCGVGFNAPILKPYTTSGELIGVDKSPHAINYSAKRNYSQLYCKKVEDLTEFSEGYFDVIIATDFIEHVEDDMLILQKIWGLLKENGLSIITVPAFQFLWSQHDEALHHIRRYTKRELKEKTTTIGFKINKHTYFNTLLFFPICVVRWMNRLLMSAPESDLKPVFKPLNEILAFLFCLESSLVKYVSFPFGVSLICICTKNLSEKSNAPVGLANPTGNVVDLPIHDEHFSDRH